jgi:hypothetical protein
MTDAALPTQIPTLPPEPTLTKSTVAPLGVLRRNLKLQVYLGIAALFTVATAVSSLHHKSPAKKLDPNAPPAPLVQDTSGANIEEMRKEIAKQQDAVRFGDSADPSLAAAQATLPTQTPLQYGPNGIPPTGTAPPQYGPPLQLTPQQQQALAFDTQERELAYKSSIRFKPRVQSESEHSRAVEPDKC